MVPQANQMPRSIHHQASEPTSHQQTYQLPIQPMTQFGNARWKGPLKSPKFAETPMNKRGSLSPFLLARKGISWHPDPGPALLFDAEL
ncbi:hypothetical protein E2320_004413 [Naja naja]|nr:hypothetical protein E2320_004413 [Naja naja]